MMGVMGVKQGAVLGVWAATVVAAFAVGRVTAPPESASAPDDFRAAIRAALGEKDGFDRAQRTTRILQQLDSENVADVAAVYDQLIHILGESDLRPFVSAWAQFDPAAAFDHTLGWTLDKQKIGAAAAIEGWAMRDPVEALRAYEETSARIPRLSEDLFLNMLTGWLYSDGGGLDEYLAGLSKSRQDMAIARVAAKLMRHGGADATIRWVNSIVRNEAYENRFKRWVFRRGVRIVGRSDPERTAAWAMEHTGHAYAQDAPRIVAEHWGSRDGRAALQWVRDHPSEDLQALAVREAFRTWSKSNRKAAVEWLETETLTAFHDPAIGFHAKGLSDPAPEEAVVWCERILDPERQLRCFDIAAPKWYQRDPVAAETWLQQSPLDEEARRAVRNPEIRRQQQRWGRAGQNPPADPPESSPED
jgi:hypothetical protein